MGDELALDLDVGRGEDVPDADGDGERVPPDGRVVGPMVGIGSRLIVGNPLGAPLGPVVGVGVGPVDGLAVGPDVRLGVALELALGPEAGVMTVVMDVEQVTVLAPALPVPLHWFTVIGIAGLIREAGTVQTTVAAAPPLPEPLHWVTVAPVVLAGKGLQCGSRWSRTRRTGRRSRSSRARPRVFPRRCRW